MLYWDQICNSPYCQPYDSYNFNSQNLVLDQLIIPKLIFFSVLITYLVDVVLKFWGEIVLVSHGSLRVKECLEEKKMILSCVLTTIPSEFAEADGSSTGFNPLTT